MENTQILIDYFNNNPDSQSIIFRFFITFARLECALKNSTAYLAGDNNQAKADWNSYINALVNFNPDSSKDLKDAVDYIIKNPPKKQVVTNGKLQFRDAIVNDPNINKQLNIYIRRIRNNLLHGGKFDGNYIPEVSRNYILLNSALIILNNWIDLIPEIKSLFTSEIL